MSRETDHAPDGLQLRMKRSGDREGKRRPDPITTILGTLFGKNAKLIRIDRETIESIVVAIILAFLFRGFVAEAFVIPTGSMAQTLRGRHMDIVCPECNYEYNTGASIENLVGGVPRGFILSTTCPICHFTLDLEKDGNPNHRSFNGDRILVSKFAYQLSEPERWDVIVFKYPGNAKQNYIKRLVGLPGETLIIRHGDIFSVDEAGNEQIVRKPPFKLRSMLQVVDDTSHVAKSLKAVNWPSRWQQTDVTEGEGWQFIDSEARYVIQASSNDRWLRYRHLAPTRGDWSDVLRNQLPSTLSASEGELITDYYSYNDTVSSWESTGTAWVGDLAIEARFEIQSDSGEVLLDLVEGGTHYVCRINIETGEATLSATDFNGVAQPFFDEEAGTKFASVSGPTKIRGQGRHRIRLANCDDQLLLWVDEKVVEFAGPTTYQPPQNVKPMWSAADPGDMAPAGLSAKGASLSVSDLRISRDIYYLAQEADQRSSSEYDITPSSYQLRKAFTDPTTWESNGIFDSRISVEYKLDEGQYFPLGDNSPQSKDARLWSQGNRLTGYHDPPPYVERQLMIAKALVVYWPHGWRPASAALANMARNIAFIPNFPQMKLIR